MLISVTFNINVIIFVCYYYIALITIVLLYNINYYCAIIVVTIWICYYLNLLLLITVTFYGIAMGFVC